MLYFIELDKIYGQLSLDYLSYHKTKSPVLLLSKYGRIAEVLTPSGVFKVELEYLAPCKKDLT